jgi:hypothetical protein
MAEIYRDKRGWLYTIDKAFAIYTALYRKPEQDNWHVARSILTSSNFKEVEVALMLKLDLSSTGIVGWYNGENSSPNPILTEEGLQHVNAYIRELWAKRIELLDGKKDTADDTEIATVADILSDMDEETVQDVGDGLEYINGWPVTDNYEADYALRLEYGKDFTWLK